MIVPTEEDRVVGVNYFRRLLAQCKERKFGKILT